MITDEKAEKYVRKLKKYCREHNCDECVLWNTDCRVCGLMRTPCNWELPDEA